MIWMLRSKPNRQALRVDVAATAATLREQLAVVRDITEAFGPHGPESEDARERAKSTHEHFLSAASRLPSVERQLAAQWEHAASMTYWYITGDRGFAPLEEQAADLLATLPDGLDHAAAREVVDAIIHRGEIAVRGLSERRTDNQDTAPTVVDQKGLLDLIADDRARLTLQEVFGPETATFRQARRHFLLWIEETLTHLSEPRTHTELEVVAEQWRSERAKYIDGNPEQANITIGNQWIRRVGFACEIADEYGIQTRKQQSTNTPGFFNFAFAGKADGDGCVFECGSSFYAVLSQGRWDSGTAQATLANQRTQSFMIFSGTKSNGSVSDLTLLSLPEIGAKFELSAADLVIAADGKPNYGEVLEHIADRMQVALG